MRNCLPLISLFLLLWLQPCMAQREYHLLMQVKGQEVTGICVIDSVADGGLVGTVINEFGAKAFDFTYNNKGKVKVLNVVAFLDKWYIRCVLRRDLAKILPTLPKDEESHYKRRWITYTFTPIHETDS